MDHELWNQLSHAMFDVARTFPRTARQTYDTHRVRSQTMICFHPLQYRLYKSIWKPASESALIPVTYNNSESSESSEKIPAVGELKIGTFNLETGNQT